LFSLARVLYAKAHGLIACTRTILMSCGWAAPARAASQRCWIADMPKVSVPARRHRRRAARPVDLSERAARKWKAALPRRRPQPGTCRALRHSCSRSSPSALFPETIDPADAKEMGLCHADGLLAH